MIKEVPHDIPMAPVMFGDGDKGMAVQVHHNEEYGVTLTSSRESRDDPFVRVITHNDIPGEFGSLDDLNKAIREHNDG